MKKLIAMTLAMGFAATGFADAAMVKGDSIEDKCLSSGDIAYVKFTRVKPVDDVYYLHGNVYKNGFKWGVIFVMNQIGVTLSSKDSDKDSDAAIIKFGTEMYKHVSHDLNSINSHPIENGMYCQYSIPGSGFRIAAQTPDDLLPQ